MLFRVFLIRFFSIGCFGLWLGCAPEKEPSVTPLFTLVPADQTGIRFANQVVESGDNHVLNYGYYYNGGGVAVGDVNNDGLPDIYFSGNQVPNKLYLNKGNFQFEDITQQAGVEAPAGWKTGVTLADVNNDGFLDIYVCRSAFDDPALRKNLLYVNNGDLTFTEKASAYGIDDPAYATQAAFFDYDNDGDLDLFLLNHSVQRYAGFSKLLGEFKNQKSDSFGSKLFRNDGGHFTDVTDKAGIHNNVLSFGLGIAVSDINQDGWQDLYVSNDYNEEDYLYLNNHDGTFAETIRQATGHVSLYSMGSDVADINNDGLVDIVTLDMLPEGNERIKMTSGDDNYDKYQQLVNAGFHHQSMRNMLQVNNGNGTFSEIGQLAGISNTDWSWSALLADYDNDGFKDLFITNGYEKDYTNMQFLKFTVDEQIRARQTGTAPSVQAILQQMPSIKTHPYIFKNNGNLTFTNQVAAWGLDRITASNGAAYADLDLDGDLDLVTNNMNEVASIYQNTLPKAGTSHVLTVDLRQQNTKLPIVGTKVYVYAGGKKQYQEFSPVRGYQSCLYGPLHFGLGKSSTVDSVEIIWPDAKYQLVKMVKADQTITPRYAEAVSTYQYTRPQSTPFFTSEENILPYTHHAWETNDFKRQFLLPFMLSYSGPHLATGDVNGDKLDDVFIGGPKGQPGALFLQQKSGVFQPKKIQAFEQDKESQDEDAVFLDADGDKDLDLYVVSGGYPFLKDDPLLQDRLYVNDGHGNFTKASQALPTLATPAQCVVAFDVDQDQDLDLFVGGGYVPGEYPLATASYLLRNNGTGTFTQESLPVLPNVQPEVIKDAVSTDLNGDGYPDLLLAGEWTPIRVLINNTGTLKDETSQRMPANLSGWWNVLRAEDMDGDGDQDLIAGNFGLNSQIKASPKEPATLVYGDFNKDGTIDPFLSYYYQPGQSYPYASRDEALGQMVELKKKFTDYTAYAQASIADLIPPEELAKAPTLMANTFKTICLENQNGKFILKELPLPAQFAPVYAIVAVDVDQDGLKDLILGGNLSKTRIRLGKMDASYGMLFRNQGQCQFAYVPQAESGLHITGDVRDIAVVEGATRTTLLFSRNNETVKSYRLKQSSLKEQRTARR